MKSGWRICAGCLVGLESEDVRNEKLVRGYGKIVSLSGDTIASFC